MLDESVVQKLCRTRVHATKRVESKRDEEKAVRVTDLPVRSDVVVVEPLKGRHGASLPPALCCTQSTVVGSQMVTSRM